ncbi:hypothetical protein JCGZ_13971 [Jatropha curcas]|uniref:PH domain-containing protein n=2 Tax=Jatropha curcas TaxID=180498 RepID=A0A067K7I9_JATCU|nr:hypothetical protein JCGZ_13971 [Jatropha curcas]
MASSETDTIQTFIVGVENDMKPFQYSELEEWYSSILQGLNSNSLSSGQITNEILHVYKSVFQGFSARLTPQQARALEERPEILNVLPNHVYQLQTTHSPQFLGLRTSNSRNSLSSESKYGANVIIGMLDTGIWPELESFNDKGLDPIPSRWKGVCQGGEGFPKTLCNKKLIGVRDLTRTGSGKNSVRDTAGHGTHTASIAAGKAVNNASFFGHAKGTAVGIAPKARLAVYKVCSDVGCQSADILAGFDKAVEDGVHVISISIGPTSALPLSMDVIAIGSFGAMENGVIVSAAAGNSGPSYSTVTNIAPWVITVGASTIDRKFPADLLLEDGTTINGISLYTGTAFGKKKFLPLIFAGESGSYCFADTLEEKLVRGKIVLCYRGGSGVQKGMHVKKAGGVGIVVADLPHSVGSSLADPHVIPGLAINDSSRQVVLKYISSSLKPRAKMVFHGTQVGVKPAPIVAFFSSRGPNERSNYVMKPDVIAPGVQILAGWTNATSITELDGDKRHSEFNIISGTSMACPHVSGIAALLKGAHGDWSPAMIKSAIMTTAYATDNGGNPILEETHHKKSTVWDMGAGHVNPEKALDPGLVYDLNTDDYLNFLCASSLRKEEIKVITRRSVNCKGRKRANPWDLNYPAISVAFDASKSTKEIVVSRTVTHVSNEGATYTVNIKKPEGVITIVQPQKMVFKRKGEKMSYKVRIVKKKHEAASVPSGFGQLTWTDGKHLVTSPLVVTWL